MEKLRILAVVRLHINKETVSKSVEALSMGEATERKQI